ncbi:hypothetical protein CEB3_c48250 [Peptococcaceae bacterium CEB3]|nr:hypothetical protein CEB3_c48250 [Peptococcaceae bacterium CEB3]
MPFPAGTVAGWEGLYGNSAFGFGSSCCAARVRKVSAAFSLAGASFLRVRRHKLFRPVLMDFFVNRRQAGVIIHLDISQNPGSSGFDAGVLGLTNNSP